MFSCPTPQEDDSRLLRLLFIISGQAKTCNHRASERKPVLGFFADEWKNPVSFHLAEGLLSPEEAEETSSQTPELPSDRRRRTFEWKPPEDKRLLRNLRKRITF